MAKRIQKAVAAKPAGGFESMLDDYFGLAKSGTNIRTETIAGLTTFLTMVYIIISVTPLRQYVINAIPRNLKFAISAGVGFFLGIIAFEQAKLVIGHPVTLVTLGDMKSPAVILFLLGFVLIVALHYLRFLGGTLIGILLVSAIGIPLGLAKFTGVVSMPPSIAPLLLA